MRSGAAFMFSAPPALHHGIGDVTELRQSLILLDGVVALDIPRHQQYLHGLAIEDTAAHRILTHPALDEKQRGE